MTVVTVEVFSAMEILAVAPPLLLVITGASLAFVIVTEMACVSVSEPSLTCTVTS